MSKHAKTENNENLDNDIAELEPDEEGSFEGTQERNEEDYPDALASLEPDVQEGDIIFGGPEQEEPAVEVEAWDSTGQKTPKKHLTVQQKKSRRMRRILIAAIVLVFLLFGALIYGTYLFWETAGQEAVQQTVDKDPVDVDELKDEDGTEDAASVTTAKTTVPNLVSLIGKTQEEAIAAIGMGALAVSSTPTEEEGNPIKSNVKISLTDEPGDTRSGTPSVYLGLSEEGVILSAGYSAAISGLGYGSVSFADAVESQDIVENVFEKAGLAIPEGQVVLPDDKTVYSEYASDKTTLVSENYSFSGDVEQDGVPYKWSSVLQYDYTAANASGKINDTVRQIYIYVNA